MSKSSRPCRHSTNQHVCKFIAYAKLRINSARIFPRRNGYREMVALALYSKCLTVAEATLVLVGAGFSDEAFGMTRTLIDIFITLRYIANKDTDERARRYYQFFAKDIKGWDEVIRDFWPHHTQELDARTQRIAATYPHPHRWSGKTVKEMALEPDTVETDPATGKPTVHDFAYQVVYRWTSHYVHPTIVALENHVVQSGHDNFVVHNGRERDKGPLAVFNTACYVANTTVCFYRCMDHPQPIRVGNWAGALMKHLTYRHA